MSCMSNGREHTDEYKWFKGKGTVLHARDSGSNLDSTIDYLYCFDSLM